MRCLFCKGWFLLSELPDPQIACCSRCGAIRTRPHIGATRRFPRKLLQRLLLRSA
jgi:hypothetical protein